MLFLSNPAGLWALLALPVILVIHCLQERVRRVRTSTLFLLERVRPESVKGSRFDRLRSSLPMWLQLLAAAVLAWLLAEPRWISQNSRQTVAVVLDSSASTSAFTDATRDLLAKSLGRWAKGARTTDWRLLESDTSKPTLYAGTDLSALLAAYDRFEPLLGTHAPDDALQNARALVKEHGAVLFVTDRETTLPAGVALLSAGEPVDNVGFGGLEVTTTKEGGAHWRALAHNHSPTPQDREWWMIRRMADGGVSESEKSPIRLEANSSVALQGELPKDLDQAELRLSDDAFALDNRLHLRRPRLPVVKVSLRVDEAAGRTLRQMLEAVERIEFVNHLFTPPDLHVATTDAAVEGNAILLPSAKYDNEELDAAWTVADEHPLTRDLTWAGLLTPKPPDAALSSGHEPLLWKGNRLLAAYQPEWGRRQLLLNWPLAKSNAARSPALLVMVQRFVERVRAGKTEPWAGNFDTRQRLEIPDGAKAKLVVGDATSDFEGRAPARPGFFRVTVDGQERIAGTANFSDTRESDFQTAKAADTSEALRVEAALRQSEADPYTPLWILVILGCFLGAWVYRR